MNNKVLKTLEYNKIIDRLVGFADSEQGKQQCRELVPVNDISRINQMQQETANALTRLYKYGSLSFSGLRNISTYFIRLDKGSSLNIIELLNISSMLDAASRVKNFMRKDEETIDSLSCYYELLEPLTPLNTELKRCILSEDEIADDASSGLKQVRRSIRHANEQIHQQLGSIVNSSSTRTMLQENIVTMRNGRYCLPVKQEYKGSFSGMIHDQSSSGSTVFIEPIAIVKLNNELSELAINEQKEIEKILAQLSNLAGEQITFLQDDYKVLCKLDFIFAKGKLAKTMQAAKPDFNTDGYIQIKKGRHPLIPHDKVVPIDVEIGKNYKLLIVTGPNTGGKTVSLKTTGLFTLMGQAGLHIPAFDHSSLAVFDEVYADIGDEQSIEQSLSTFSSHMTNTISILKEANENSLALFDELGAGTDPTEGAALAISILSDLHQRRVTAMATTHYSELKVFALSTDGVENACCEFDVQSLRPTYRLLIGIPGKSNAFAISSKLGLPDYIIEEAKKHIDTEAKNFEDVISSLEESRITIEREQTQLKKYKEEVETLKIKLQEKSEKLDISRDKILKNANEEANEILQKAKDFADESIRKYNKWMQDGVSSKEMENQRNALREKLKGTQTSDIGSKKKRQSKNYKASDFHIGDAVFVNSMGIKGTVSTLPNEKGDLFVQMGILRSQVNMKDLDKIDEPEITAPNLQRTGSGKMKMSKASTISTEINLIGKTVDEALPLLDKYLDDAYLAHLTQVTVIHGIGTGALKNGVHSHLKKQKYIKSYRLGEFGEGGYGVTVVEFK